MVRITEASVARDDALRGLAVSVTLKDGESVESDFHQIKDALLEWQRRCGKAAASVLIECRSPDTNRQQVEDFWLTKFESDHLVRAAFASVGEVTLCLMDLEGRNIRQIWFELGGKYDA